MDITFNTQERIFPRPYRVFVVLIKTQVDINNKLLVLVNAGLYCKQTFCNPLGNCVPGICIFIYYSQNKSFILFTRILFRQLFFYNKYTIS